MFFWCSQLALYSNTAMVGGKGLWRQHILGDHNARGKTETMIQFETNGKRNLELAVSAAGLGAIYCDVARIRRSEDGWQQFILNGIINGRLGPVALEFLGDLKLGNTVTFQIRAFSVGDSAVPVMLEIRQHGKVLPAFSSPSSDQPVNRDDANGFKALPVLDAPHVTAESAVLGVEHFSIFLRGDDR